MSLYYSREDDFVRIAKVENRLRYDILDTSRPLEETAHQLRKAGQWASLAQLLDSLPMAKLNAAPELRLLRAEAALRLADAHQAVAHINAMLAAEGEIPSLLRAKALLIRSAASRLRGFPDKALEDASTATSILEAGSSPVELLIEGCRQMGIALGMTGELDRAIEHLERGLRLCAKSSDLEVLANIQHALGIILARLGQLSEAQVHFNNAQAAYRKLDNFVELSSVLDNMGRLQYLLGEYDTCLTTLQEALQLAKEFNYSRTEAMIRINIGDTLVEMAMYEKALESYQSALQLGGEALEPRLFCCANSGIGSVYLFLKDFKRADFFLKQAAYEAERLNLRHELAMAKLSQGILACRVEDYGRAKEELGKCVALFQAIGAPGHLIKAYLSLSLVLFKTKKWTSLNELLHTLTRLVDDLDMESQLVREAKAVPEVIDYAASKRIGGKLFQTVKEGWQTKREQPSFGVLGGVGAVNWASPQPRVEVYGLGEFEVLVDGRRVSDSEWESQKAKELFLHLLCHRGGKSREQLLEILWPEISVSLGRNAFYNNVYRTKRALYKDCIVLIEGRYKVNPQGEFCFDLQEFQRLIGEAERLPRENDERATFLTKAIKLYRGPFLEEFYAEWVDTIRWETEALYLRCLSRLADFHAARGHHEIAIRLLEDFLAVDKTDVEANEQIIKLLLKSGDLVSAQRRYKFYSDLSIKELGVPLGKEFAQLRREAAGTL